MLPPSSASQGRQKAAATNSLQCGGHRGAEVGRSFDGFNAGGVHRGVFVFCGALAPGNDRACMAHAASGRSGLAGDEADDRLLHVGFDPVGSGLLRIAANFANQNHSMRVGIFVEEFDRIEERSTDNGIAADSDAGGLANAKPRELINRFVSKRAAAADNTYVSVFVDAARHDTNFTFARRNDARTVGADEARLRFVDNGDDADHVNYRNSLGDAYDQGNFGVSSFKNGVCRIRWRNENHRSIGTSSFYGFRHGIENRPLQMFCAAFARGYAANDIGGVLDHLLRVESAFTAGEALDD